MAYIEDPKITLLKNAVKKRSKPSYYQSPEEYQEWNKSAPEYRFIYKKTIKDKLMADDWGQKIVEVKDNEMSHDYKNGQARQHRPNRYKNWATGKLGEVATAIYLGLSPKWDFTAKLGHKYDTDIIWNEFHLHIKTRNIDVNGWVVDPKDDLFTKTKPVDILVLVENNKHTKELYIRGFYNPEDAKKCWRPTETINNKKAIDQNFIKKYPSIF